jgi:hypothetical protein
MLAIDGMLKFATAFLTYDHSDRDGESLQALSYVGAPPSPRETVRAQSTDSQVVYRAIVGESSGP